ncbi:MAG: NUDIX hydrolase, partial [Pseudomonadota bacterium]
NRFNSMIKKPDKQLSWELLNVREDRKYNLFSVEINTCASPRTGLPHQFQVLRSVDWVAVLAVTKEKEVVLVNQFRHGIRDLSLELPGGLVKPGQTPQQSAAEELEEETGFTAPEMKLLGSMYPFPAIFSNRFHVYLAENAEPKGKMHPDETEELETVLAPASELKNFIRDGKINCGIMIAAISFCDLFADVV